MPPNNATTHPAHPPDAGCKTCTRNMPTDRAPRGFTRFRILGAALEQWGLNGLGESCGAVHFRNLKPCDAIVGVHAGLYDAAGDPLEGATGGLIDIFGARRQIEQIAWPRGVPGDLRDGPAWDRYRGTQDMRVTMGTIRRTALRARELYADNFAQTFPQPRDFESREYAPVTVVMWSRPLGPTAPAFASFQCAIDYREQAYCAV